jgi:hypothetical protein
MEEAPTAVLVIEAGNNSAGPNFFRRRQAKTTVTV